MSAGRMEAFSDGVIAIIITVMVLSLGQPHGSTFASLRDTFPSLLAYVLSFVNLGIYWVNHHHLLRTIHRVSGGMLWANLNLLFWLSLFPFGTAWMSTHGFATVPIATYGVILSLAALAYFILQTVIVAKEPGSGQLREILGRDWKGKGSLISYVASIPLAFAWRWGSLVIFVGVAITWLIPDRRLAAYLAGHTHDDEDD